MANLLYNLAQPFSDTKQYTQGTIVVYNDRMYEMTADEYTPGPFDPEKFTERFLSEMISGKLNSNLSKANYLYSQVYKNDTTAQSWTVFENVSASKVTVTQSSYGDVTQGYTTVQGADDAEFTQNGVSIGETNATGSIVERDISNYKYIRIVVVRVANGKNKVNITFS